MTQHIDAELLQSMLDRTAAGEIVLGFYIRLQYAVTYHFRDPADHSRSTSGPLRFVEWAIRTDGQRDGEVHDCFRPATPDECSGCSVHTYFDTQGLYLGPRHGVFPRFVVSEESEPEQPCTTTSIYGWAGTR